MNKKDLEGRDLLLTLLYLPGVSPEVNEPIRGRTKIMKMIYIFEKELYGKFNNIKLKKLPSFFAYNFGPFSKDLADDLKFFCSIKFIKEDYLDEPMSEVELEEYCYDMVNDYEYSNDVETCVGEGQNIVNYSLTEKGVKYVKENILNLFNEEQTTVLKMLKRKINELSLDAILNYVYNKYPESAKKSKIKDKYLKV